MYKAMKAGNFESKARVAHYDDYQTACLLLEKIEKALRNGGTFPIKGELWQDIAHFLIAQES